MAGERQLTVGHEDADVVAVVAHGRHEGGLGKVDLARDREHLLGGEPLRRLGHDAELVPGERNLREDVDEPEGDAHTDEYLRGAHPLVLDSTTRV